MTIAKTQLSCALILNLVYVVLIRLYYGESNLRILSWYIPPLFLYDISNLHLYHKIIPIGVAFSYNSYNSFLFSSHALAWTCILHLKLSGYACFLYISVNSQWISIQLVLQLTYACATSIAIFILILSLKVLPESTLHSGIKASIAHISIIVFHQDFMEDCYINVKFDSIILCNTFTPQIKGILNATNLM